MTLFALILISIFGSGQKMAPPGTVQVGHLYIDQTEVLNIHWLEYVHYKGKELDSTEHWTILPDSANTWFDRSVHRYKPIMLITYEQALGYCEWRSEVVSEKLGYEVTYRLPTIEEWELVAQAVLYKNERKVMKDLEDLKAELDEVEGKYYMRIRVPEQKEVYDLFSNVSEMTSTPGIAKGGNNDALLERDQLLINLTYTDISIFLGFRCIAEVGR